MRNIRHLTPVPLALAIALSAQPTQAAGYSLEEVVVTAQKREQSAMDVPIAIDTFSASNMENTGALALGDIADYIPGFEVGDGVTQATMKIRGVGSANISSGGDASVATFYDGVYLPRAATTIAFSDMERIEILKGPQGTLAGRNAAAGSINMVPNKPTSDEIEGFVQLKAGNYDLMRWEGMANIPLTDNLAIRANLLSNQRDGYLDNTAPGGEDLDTQDSLTGRLALLWDISERTSLQINYDFDDTDNGPRSAVGYNSGNLSFDRTANDTPNGEETRDMYSAGFRLNHELNDNWSLSWWANHREFDVTNLDDQDGTGNIFTYLDTNNIESSELTYTELQFNYDSERVHFVTGLTWSSENKSQQTDITSTAETASGLATQVSNGLLQALGAPFGISSLWDPTDWAMFSAALTGAPLGQSNAEYQGLLGGLYALGYGDLLAPYNSILSAGFIDPSYAGSRWTESVINSGKFTNMGIYADIDLAVSDKLNLIMGVRYSRDEKDFTWENPTATLASTLNAERQLLAQFGVPAAALIPTAANFLSPLSLSGVGLVSDTEVKASDSWSKLTGRMVVQYQLSEDAMTFLTYSTGYTSGGYDSFVLNSSVTPLEPEEVTNLEWGIKGDFFGGRLRAQFSYFDMEMENRQKSVTSADPEVPGLAAPIIISGDEDISGWELSLTWIPVDRLQLGLVTTMRDNDSQYQNYVDAQGNPAGGEKEEEETLSAYTLTLDWAPKIPVGSLNVHIDYIFEEQDFGPDDADYLPIYEHLENFGADKKTLNARLAWSSDDERYLLALWGKNLLDQQYTGIPGGLAASDLGAAYTDVSAPLTWGIDARYQF
ncbi:TonB-dependent receptor [Pseudomaricurvus alkylphenolicus]|uniref:TonB-dependent receptor n=1 Tax=Pseudomaricurvus alkylphenolicus TaxID=1306991 RepID=UPI00141FE7D5|nr:TonB-dependent receptor [Pseudomaricurvus alkylphenolicus]NIB40147.1 TonB-dependent receptor [Pseudomaricurvus alkylphenolicus]